MAKRKKKNKRITYSYNSKEWKAWREAVYQRDNYSCQLCGAHGRINAHHIKRKVDYPEFVYKVANGIVLCQTCHVIVTEREHIFEALFEKINAHKLTPSYAIGFLNSLVTNFPIIILEFKYNERWQHIPITLLQKANNVEERKIKRHRR